MKSSPNHRQLPESPAAGTVNRGLHPLLFDNFFLTCSTTVSSPAIVTLQSGKAIRFFPGFTATGGCVLTAPIDECELSNYDPDDTGCRTGNLIKERSPKRFGFGDRGGEGQN